MRILFVTISMLLISFGVFGQEADLEVAGKVKIGTLEINYQAVTKISVD